MDVWERGSSETNILSETYRSWGYTEVFSGTVYTTTQNCGVFLSNKVLPDFWQWSEVQYLIASIKDVCN